MAQSANNTRNAGRCPKTSDTQVDLNMENGAMAYEKQLAHNDGGAEGHPDGAPPVDDAIVEDKTVISNYSQISGHCNIQTGAWLSGMVVMHQFVTISKWVYAAGFSGINHDIPPFMIVCGHYPPEVRSVNKRGLARAGLDDDQKEKVFDAFKKLYKQDGVLLEKAKIILEQTDDENVKDICESIINSSKHRFGRYLESFRH